MDSDRELQKRYVILHYLTHLWMLIHCFRLVLLLHVTDWISEVGKPGGRTTRRKTKTTWPRPAARLDEMSLGRWPRRYGGNVWKYMFMNLHIAIYCVLCIYLFLNFMHIHLQTRRSIILLFCTLCITSFRNEVYSLQKSLHTSRPFIYLYTD
jgi:hypothetical protein